MKAFITGITGMTGSFLAEHLLACGDEVQGCSRRGIWPASMPEALTSRVQPLAWDCATPPGEQLTEELARFAPDCIFHLAALSVPAECGEAEPTPHAALVNVGGTEAVCRLAAMLPGIPRIVLASSCLVYGAVDPRHVVVAEDAPLAPLSGYGKTKLAAEGVLQSYAETSGFDAVIVRAFHHAGPRQASRLMVAEWARQLVAQRDDPLRFITRDAYLDLCDVRDVARALRMIAVRRPSGRRPEVFNLGSGRSVRSGDVLDLMRKLSGSQRDVIETAPGVRQNPIADTSRIRRETGWRPEIPLEQTLWDTLEFWRGRPDGVEVGE
jgi:GDP-4-dehydro-6-deoxy-D-mannose reductase